MPKWFIISGPSGVGKKTLIDQFIGKPELNLQYSVSMTTRPQRPGEVEGKDYYFVTPQQFDAAIAQDGFIEWAEFCKNKYGTPRQEIDRIFGEGKNALMEIEVLGATQVLEQNRNNPNLVSIFIIPPSLEELERRLTNRKTETPERIEWRMMRAREEIHFQNQYDYVVVNDDRKRAAEEIEKIIRNEIGRD